MIAAALLAAGLALLPAGSPWAEDPLARTPEELPKAPEGRWQGLFEGRELQEDRLPMELAPLVKRARIAYARGDYPAALATLYELLEREPDFPPSLLEMGTVYFRLRRYGDAVVCLERFLEVAPGQVWRTQALAHAYYSLGRYEDARAHYERVLAVLPESVEAVRGLALSHYRLGDYERALELLDRALELEPDHVESLVWRAQILNEVERSEEALESALRARDLDRFEPRPWYLLWQIQLDLGNDEEAEAARQEWDQLDGLVQEARGLEGRLLFRPHDYGLALRLAQVEREIGDVDATRDALARAVRNRPEEVSELDLRIFVLDVLFEMGDAEGAAQAAQELERACPDEAEAWKRLETYYARIGDGKNQVRAGERRLRLGR